MLLSPHPSPAMVCRATQDDPHWNKSYVPTPGRHEKWGDEESCLRRASSTPTAAGYVVVGIGGASAICRYSLHAWRTSGGRIHLVKCAATPGPPDPLHACAPHVHLAAQELLAQVLQKPGDPITLVFTGVACIRM